MDKYKYIFGPVPSRRLGLSLGIDLVPFKTCSYNCIYCECGKTTNLTIERKSYINKEEALNELKLFLEKKIELNYITFSGGGEPTLSIDIEFFINEIKKICEIPICVLTNGSLLFLKEVRKSILNVDVVIPSLDAVSKDIFQKINRPHKELKIEKIIEGLIEFRKEYKGKYILEILFVKGINDSEEEVKKIAEITEEIRPDKIQLNTMVRPGTEKNLTPLTEIELNNKIKYFNRSVEIISHFKREIKSGINKNEIISIIERRPCTINDLIKLTNQKKLEIEKMMYLLKEEGNKIKEIKKDGEVYYFIEKEE